MEGSSFLSVISFVVYRVLDCGSISYFKVLVPAFMRFLDSKAMLLSYTIT